MILNTAQRINVFIQTYPIQRDTILFDKHLLIIAAIGA